MVVVHPSDPNMGAITGHDSGSHVAANGHSVTLNVPSNAPEMVTGRPERTRLPSSKNRCISIHRAVYDQDIFDKEFGRVEPVKKTPIERVQAKAHKTKTKCQNGPRWLRILSNLVPVTQWLPHYNVRENLVNDLIAGLTVGIMNIPQSMAYAMLAKMPLVFGLYMSVFPAIFYFFFGTSRHLAIGVFAIISLMVGTAMDKIALEAKADYAHLQHTYHMNNMNTSNYMYSDNFTDALNGSFHSMPDHVPYCDFKFGGTDENMYIECNKVKSLQDLVLITGIFSFAFGLFRCGFVGDVLSDQLTQGLTTGAAVQIGSSQVAHLFGIPGLPKTSGVLGVPKFYYQLFSRITESNWVTCILAAVALAILLVHKIKTGPMFIQKFKIPLPLELIIVIIATAISIPLRLGAPLPPHNNGSTIIDHNITYGHGVAVVGAIPKGLPKPTLPLFERVGTILPDAFVIAIITFALQISIAKIYAKKHGYTIRPNQEWFAMGFTNIFSSFFHCWCSGASIPRTAVQEGTGGKTQVTGLVAAVLMIVVLEAIADLFSPLPNAILAAIVCAALVTMLKQVQVLPTLWRRSKCDFWIFVSACVGVIFLDIAYGLLLAVVVSIMSLLYRTIWPHSRLLGRLKNTNEYEAPDVYCAASEVPHLKIFRFEAPLFYANVSTFKEALFKATVNPMIALKKLKKLQKRARKAGQPTVSKAERMKNMIYTITKRPQQSQQSQTEPQSTAPDVEKQSMASALSWPEFNLRASDIRYIIIDCSSISFIDYPGCTALKEVCLDYEKIDIPILLACCNVGFREMMARVQFHEYIPKTAIFVSVHDAVQAVQLQRKLTEVPSNGITLNFVEEENPEDLDPPQYSSVDSKQSTVSNGVGHM